jgi:hypothetical protein
MSGANGKGRGGFGAFTAMERERRAASAAAERAPTVPSVTPLSDAKAASSDRGPQTQPSHEESAQKNADETARGPAGGN